MTAGEYWRIASKAADLIFEIEGTDLAHWSESLSFLVRDAQREAGAECVRELQHPGSAAGRGLANENVTEWRAA